MTVEELVARDCAAQGLPMRVTDPTALGRIATLISASGNGERRAQTRRPTIEKETHRETSTASSRP